jgi:hypothetical protein
MTVLSIMMLIGGITLVNIFWRALAYLPALISSVSWNG